MVFSIWAALARASSNSLSLSSSLLSQSAPATSPIAPSDPSPRPPSPGDSSSGGLELGVPPVGLGVWVRLSGERIPLSGPRPRLHSRPPPADLPPSDRWGLGVWFMMEAVVWTSTVRRVKRAGGCERGDSGKHHPHQSVISLETETGRKATHQDQIKRACTTVPLTCLENKFSLFEEKTIQGWSKKPKESNFRRQMHRHSPRRSLTDTLRSLWGGKALICCLNLIKRGWTAGAHDWD